MEHRAEPQVNYYHQEIESDEDTYSDDIFKAETRQSGNNVNWLIVKRRVT